MTPATTAPATRRGFRLPCIKCGETGYVRVMLDALDDDGEYEDGAFNCTACEADFSFEEVRTFVGQWQKALAWLDTAPVLADE